MMQIPVTRPLPNDETRGVRAQARKLAENWLVGLSRKKLIPTPDEQHFVGDNAAGFYEDKRLRDAFAEEFRAEGEEWGNGR